MLFTIVAQTFNASLTSLCQILQYDRQMKFNVNYTRRSVY